MSAGETNEALPIFKSHRVQRQWCYYTFIPQWKLSSFTVSVYPHVVPNWLSVFCKTQKWRVRDQDLRSPFTSIIWWRDAIKVNGDRDLSGILSFVSHGRKNTDDTLTLKHIKGLFSLFFIVNERQDFNLKIKIFMSLVVFNVQLCHAKSCIYPFRNGFGLSTVVTSCMKVLSFQPKFVNWRASKTCLCFFLLACCVFIPTAKISILLVWSSF